MPEASERSHQAVIISMTSSGVEVSGGNFPQGFLELVVLPEKPSGLLEPNEYGLLFLGRSCGFFSNTQRVPLNFLAIL